MGEMIKVKTAELIGPALDWAAGTADGGKLVPHKSGLGQWEDSLGNRYFTGYSPSTNWAHGGPLIDKYKISVMFWGDSDGGWTAHFLEDAAHFDSEAPNRHGTPCGSALVAACRLLISDELGDVVSVPAELASP